MTAAVRIDYNGRRFRPVGGDEATVATYRQEGDLLWGEFGGTGETRRGALCGLAAPDGTIEFTYTMVLAGGEIVAGRCRSTPYPLGDGRIGLHEIWERYGDNPSAGESELEEV